MSNRRNYPFDCIEMLSSFFHKKGKQRIRAGSSRAKCLLYLDSDLVLIIKDCLIRETFQAEVFMQDCIKVVMSSRRWQTQIGNVKIP